MTLAFWLADSLKFFKAQLDWKKPSSIGKPISALVVIIIMGMVNLSNGYSDYINYGFEPISSESDFSIARLASGLSHKSSILYHIIYKVHIKWAIL